MSNLIENLFRPLINECLKNNDWIPLNIIFVALISSDNNMTKEELNENIGSLIDLQKVLGEFDNIEYLRDINSKITMYLDTIDKTP